MEKDPLQDGNEGPDSTWLDAYDSGTRYNIFTESHEVARAYEDMLNDMEREGTLDDELVWAAIKDLDKETGHVDEQFRATGNVIKRIAKILNQDDIIEHGTEPDIDVIHQNYFAEDMIFYSQGYYPLRNQRNEDRPYRIFHYAYSQAAETLNVNGVVRRIEQNFYLIPIDNSIDIQPRNETLDPDVHRINMYLPGLLEKTDHIVQPLDTSDRRFLTHAVRSLSTIGLDEQSSALAIDLSLSVEYIKYLNQQLALTPHRLYKLSGIDMIMRCNEDNSSTKIPLNPSDSFVCTIPTIAILNSDVRTFPSESQSAQLFLTINTPDSTGKKQEFLVPFSQDISIKRCRQLVDI